MNRSTADALLSHSFLRNVFDRVVNARSIHFEDLAQSESKTEVSWALKQLKAEGLVGKSSCGVEDLDTYYPTGRGLVAYRELRECESKFDSI